jgi:hypothetical protein
MIPEEVYIYIIIVTCVLEKQTNLLEQTISPPPTYHVVYHDLYLISNHYLTSKCAVHFKTFVGRQQTKPFPLRIQIYSIFYD